MRQALPRCVSLLLAVLITLGASGPSLARGPAAAADVRTRAQALIDADTARLQAIFEDIHQNPELGFMETRTAAIIAKELQALGYEVKTGIGKTGVVGLLRNGPGPTVMYRADMDANAVEEQTGVPYASKVRVKRQDGAEVPVAHMCGHDAHVTWLLSVAKVMVTLKSEWSGTLILLAQPAEEIIAGARAMVDDGLYTKNGVPVPDFLVGLHTTPRATGTVVGIGGVRMAGTDQLDVLFHGVGSHGSTPQLSKDPVVMAATAVMQYQTVVSRVIDPLETAVLTVGAIQAGTDNNVIPDRALLKLNLRYFKPAIREQMLDAIRRINAGIAVSNGLPDALLPTITMKGHSTPLVNDEALVKRLDGPLAQLLGDASVIKALPPMTGSEDFHLLKGDHEAIPSAYFWVGIAEPAVYDKAKKEGKEVPFGNHSPFYKVDPASIPIGAKVGATVVLELLAKH